MEKTNSRQEFTGKVISAANNKTITVLVETYMEKELSTLKNMQLMTKIIKLK